MNVLHMMCCRLFGYGIGIHLLQSEDPENMPRKTEINPKDNHISFQVISFELDSIVSPLYALNYSWIELFLLLNFFFSTFTFLLNLLANLWMWRLSFSNSSRRIEDY